MVDGANRWQQFQNITIHMLKPVMIPAIVLGTVWTFNNINVLWLVSNGGEPSKHFGRAVLLMIIESPFEVADRKGEFDVIATVKGGGLSGQAGALRHGISHALVNFEPALRAPLKSKGFLTRDSRVVERKKYGRRKARRSYQFSKR